jgi:uncharacterized membrane protein YoaK (UPF0700 family)
VTEQIEQERQILGLLYLGTALTGLVDAVSYVGLGHVFTANMTGNVVLLGFAIAGTAGLSVSRSLTALAAFMAGALMGGRIATTLGPQSIQRWRITAIATESTFLLAATLVSLGHHLLFNDSTRLYAVIIFTALAMGMRNATVRKIGQPDLTTTVLTLTITGLAADSSVAGGNNPRWQRRVLSIVLMFSGAAAGALLVKHSLALPLAVATVATVCVVISLYATSEEPVGRTDIKASASPQKSSTSKQREV